MLDYKVGRRKVRWFALNGGVDHHLYFRLKGTTTQSMAHVRTFKAGYELIVTETDIRYASTRQEMAEIVLSLW